MVLRGKFGGDIVVAERVFSAFCDVGGGPFGVSIDRVTTCGYLRVVFFGVKDFGVFGLVRRVLVKSFGVFYFFLKE